MVMIVNSRIVFPSRLFMKKESISMQAVYQVQI
jgi:hypothetical protein